MIHAHNDASQTRWDRGDFKVQLLKPGSSRPVGFCDGSAADLAELKSLAEAEGAEELVLHKKLLKSGREIWTIGDAGAAGDGGADSD